MHIALGAYLLSGIPGYRQAGIHRYIKSVLMEFAGMETPRFTALVSPTALGQLPQEMARAAASRPAETPFARIRVEQLETPSVLRQLKADVYHGMAFVAPLRAPCQTVVTVHDLSFITCPETHKPLNRAYLSLFTRWSCRRAARVIAVSEWTRQDVAHYFGVLPDKIDVIPHGVPPRFVRASPDDIRQFRREKNVGANSILFLGSLEPRKNLLSLIESLPALGLSEYELIVIGGEGWKFSGVYERVKALGLEQRVRFEGYVADADLPLWLSACDVFAYPSLYEGFGMPVLEAMACGAVVVCSNSTSLPEVVGDAGLTHPPTDVPALAAALRRALTDEPLRAALRQKAITRAAGYTWQNAAQLTVRTYQKCKVESVKLKV